jgi:hypothetical protein
MDINVTIDTKTKTKTKTKIINKGTGAGGANTNVSGKPFEEKTSIIPELIKLNFQKKVFGKGKKDYYYIKEDGNKKIFFLEQNGFQKYISQTYNKNVRRKPDEAFIIEEKNKEQITVKILEKKNQNGEGSTFDKIFNGPTILDEYQSHLGDKFKVEYSYCLSEFFKKKLNEDYYNFYRNRCKKENINIFYADDVEYFKKISNWVLKDKSEICDLSKEFKNLKIQNKEIEI